MTDLEITKACAEAMGYHSYPPIDEEFERSGLWSHDPQRPQDHSFWYRPLTSDAQAMALVKRFELEIIPRNDKLWVVTHISDDSARNDTHEMNADLNRAICECVAKMRKS